MYFTDEELIAYLLGDSAPSIARQIESQRASDPELASRLDDFRKLLGHLESALTAEPVTGDDASGVRIDSEMPFEPPAGPFEPPAGLVESTMARVFGVEADDILASRRKTKAQANQSAGMVTRGVGLSAGLDVARSPRSIWDSTALTICLTVLCCLALPTLVRARFEARRSQCADNLRNTGRGLFGYALNDPRQRLPEIAMHGPASFAGANVLHLYEAGFLNSFQQMLCPSLSSHFQAARANAMQQQLLTEALYLKFPSEMDLYELSEADLERVQVMSGGDYALPLGVMEDGRPVAPRHEGRSAYPIASDAPVFRGVEELFIAHDGYGINILYDDGHVRFFSVRQLRQAQAGYSTLDCLADDPFCNERGEHRIGLSKQDSSLAPSHYSPLGVTE